MRPANAIEDDGTINKQEGHPGLAQSTTIGIMAPEERSSDQKKLAPAGCKKFLESVKRWLTYEDKGKWIEDMRGMLSLVATMISTMTFQVAINPPGGVFQANDKIPGQSVLANKEETDETYADFILFNTICFGASLGVTLLLVSGIPLKYSFPMWLLSVGMCITLTFLALTYFYALRLVNPSNVTAGRCAEFYEAAPYIWVILMVCIALVLTIRFSVWILYLCLNKLQPHSCTAPRNKEVPVNAM